MGIVFLIISIVLFISSLEIPSLICSIVALIISAKDLKTKKAINTIAFIGSIIMLIVYLLTFIIAFKTTNKALTEAKLNVYKTIEQRIENTSDTYFIEKEVSEGKTFDETTIITLKELEYDMQKLHGIECSGYVTYDSKNKSDAFIKCDDYQTDGYDINKDLY